MSTFLVFCLFVLQPSRSAPRRCSNWNPLILAIDEYLCGIDVYGKVSNCSKRPVFQRSASRIHDKWSETNFIELIDGQWPARNRSGVNSLEKQLTIECSEGVSPIEWNRQTLEYWCQHLHSTPILIASQDGHTINILKSFRSNSHCSSELPVYIVKGA